jgi:predicted amidohydrolase
VAPRVENGGGERDEHDRDGDRMRIAVGQLPAHTLGDAAAALAEAVSVVGEAGRAGAELCVLPEATYPAYVIGSAAAAREVLATGPDPLATFTRAARTAGCAVVVGLVLDRPGGPGNAGLENAALLIGADGSIHARTAKRFLWHFDHEWFVAGRESPVHDGIGMLVCADARLPEIAADLAGRGARLIANPTAWVTALPPPEGTNSQAEFLWRVRALENRVVGVAATKVGTEADTVIYAGRSQIVGADGTVLAVASATEPDLLVADVALPDSHHEELAVDDPDLAPSSPPPGPPFPPAVRPPLRAGFVQVAVLSDDDLLDHLNGHAIDLAVGPGGVLRRGDAAVVCFTGDELLDPRAARAAAAAGTEFIAWLADRVSTPLVEAVARTRALENRVFVLLWRPAAEGGPCVIDPAGVVVARAAAPRFAVQASCLRAATATKAMAPGTDAWDTLDSLARSAFDP